MGSHPPPGRRSEENPDAKREIDGHRSGPRFFHRLYPEDNPRERRAARDFALVTPVQGCALPPTAQVIIPSMFCWAKPERHSILAFISGQRNQKFSYAEVGCSQRRQAPDGYTADHHRVSLGQGIETFERAKRAVTQWKMFDMPWLELCWPDTPIEPGATVAVLVSHLGFWSMNACRIVYVIDEHGSSEKYGFAYGTLPDHMERGEERFSVEFHPDDQTVWYDVYAFSRPSMLARLAYPFARVLQKRFARGSMAAMQKAVQQK